MCFPGEHAIRQMLGLPPVNGPGRESLYERLTCGVGNVWIHVSGFIIHTKISLVPIKVTLSKKEGVVTVRISNYCIGVNSRSSKRR